MTAPLWVTVAVAVVGTVTTIGGWFLSAKRARSNALESNRDNNTLKERNEVYALLLVQGARYLKDEPVDPTQIDPTHEAKLSIYASTAVQKAWADFRQVMQPAGAGGDLGRLIGDAIKFAPESSAEVDDFNRRHNATGARLRKMAEGRYQLLAAAIRTELLPSSELRAQR